MGSALVTKSQNTVSVQNLMQSVQCNFKKKKISAFIPRENFFLRSSVHNGKGGSLVGAHLPGASCSGPKFLGEVSVLCRAGRG